MAMVWADVQRAWMSPNIYVVLFLSETAKFSVANIPTLNYFVINIEEQIIIVIRSANLSMYLQFSKKFLSVCACSSGKSWRFQCTN